MQETTSREKILKKVRSALIQKTPNPYPKLDFDSSVYQPLQDEVPELIFAQRFSEAGGNFIFCENKVEFAESLLNLAEEKKWKQIICAEKELSDFLHEVEFPHQSNIEWPNTDAVITSCECLVTRTGSILVSSSNIKHRALPFFTPVHIVYATTNQLVNDLKDAFLLMKSKYKNKLPSSMTFITGPAVTTAFDGTLVKGGQGPKELFIFLVDNNE
jgi:L-lactate dehydrogenase complex protein LldG